jgi:energy-coupling factor transporter ATP-binding protein EcfA2
MKLDKLILVNWGSLRTQEYPMGNMSLLTGPTGSGKSTMLDALQTVMTAVYQNIFSYNPGQDETNQASRNGKTKRTLWSYIVGAEDNLFARPHGAHGYIAAVFKPSEGEEGNEFTALVAVAARVDGSGERRHAIQEKLVLLIIDDAALALEDLIEVEDGGLIVIPVETIDSHLNLKYRGHVNNYRDIKREYLCQLYGRFRGRKSGVPFPEAEQAARAWSQSIAHKPIGSVDELVKTQILEHDSLQLSQRITQISGLMRQVSGLRADGERLKGNISRLERVAQHSSEATNAYQLSLQYHLFGSKKSLRDDEARQSTLEKAIESLEAQIKAEAQRSQSLTNDQNSLQQSQIQLAARLQGMPVAEQKRSIEGRLTISTKLARTSISMLLASIGSADVLQTTARQVLGKEYPPNLRVLEGASSAVAMALAPCADLTFGANTEVLERLNSGGDLDVREILALSRVFEGADAKFSALHSSLSNTENSFASALHTQIAGLHVAVSEAEKREKDAAARKANLAQGGADYPRYIQFALSRIRSDLHGARTQVLCDLIEPAAGGWQPAIEGYMGGARFNFVVDPDWEARAINFIREQGLKGSILQGSLCIRHAREDLMPVDSIVHELSTDHPIARAYLVDQFGGVVKVPDAETLRHTSRGLTKDGKGSGGRTMFTADEKELVFGKEAKRRALERAEKDHAEAESQLSVFRDQLKTLQALLGLVGKITLPTFAAVHELEQAARDIGRAKEDLSHLDLTEVAQLEAQNLALAQELSGINEQIRASYEMVGGFNTTIGLHRADLARIAGWRDAKLSKVAADTSRLQNLAMVNGALSFTALEDQVEALLTASSFSTADIQNKATSNMLETQGRMGDLREALSDYNGNSKYDERFDLHFGFEVRNDDFAPVYGQVVALHQKVRDQLANQREIGLVKNLEQLRTAESSFKDVFTKQFCYEIRNTVDNGVKTLRSLNHELDKIKFGTDKFRIDWSVWVPEFKEYYDFFSAAYDLSESQESGDLFGADGLSADNCKVRDRLVSLLLSEDQDRALKELQRVADYRNFRQYEIWKESEIGSKIALSEWGTGSGGQLETPAYIVRAAVVTNRLKHFEKGINLKMMVNDESFAKMDERRAHDVIKFLRDHLGMQLLCAMPTKHAGAIKSEFTKEWSFTRTEAEGNGEVDFVSEADERDLHPDQLRELWATRRGQVRLQAQIAFEDDERKRA